MFMSLVFFAKPKVITKPMRMPTLWLSAKHTLESVDQSQDRRMTDSKLHPHKKPLETIPEES